MGKRWIAISVALMVAFAFAAASIASASGTGEEGAIWPPPAAPVQNNDQLHQEQPHDAQTPTATPTLEEEPGFPPTENLPEATPNQSDAGISTQEGEEQSSYSPAPSPVEQTDIPVETTATPAPLPEESGGPEASGKPVEVDEPEESDEPEEKDHNKQYGVVIQAHDTVVQQHDTSFALLSLVSAVTESGEYIAVRILDNGGYDVDVAGTYRVLFGAAHPISYEEFSAACTILVQSNGQEEMITQEEMPSAPDLSGTSDERYQKYQQYRDEISDVLQEHMQRLSEAYAQRIDILRTAFSDVQQYQLLRRVFLEQEETDEWIDDAALAMQHASLESIDQPNVTNWGQVLAVFVAKSTLNAEDPLDLYNLRKISFDGLDEVFWDMHDLSFQQNGEVMELVLTEYAGEEMAARYGFDAARKAQLDELLQPEFQRLFAALTGDVSFLDISEEEIAAIRATLPAGLNMHRENVVLQAHTLVGEVRYFWGGKYRGLGWNPLWGVPKVVQSKNSPTTGTVRPLGLDCSGFVSWVFMNAAGDTSVSGAIGNGSANQWSNSKSLGWDEAEPGDLAFFAVPGTVPTNHVGIVVEKKAGGSYMVAHCSSSQNDVVITEAWSTGFRYMRRPVLLGDA